MSETRRQAVVSKVREVAQAWRDEADALARRHEQDPVIQVLKSCADDLDAKCEAVLSDTTPLSVREYSKEHGIWPSTVRRWIARGELAAVRNDSGDYEIPRDARREKGLRLAS